MPLISFFVRRFLTGTVARAAANFMARRFKMSPGAANIAFVVLTEVLARATEKSGGASKPAGGASKAGGATKNAGGRFGRRG